LVESNDTDKLNPELEDRLDDLFDENNTALPDNDDRAGSEYYPLSELKNLILSIDWEITDEVLGKLLQQIKDLNMIYEHDKTVLTFCRS
jgi:S-adenosylmethionine synthetase